MALPPFDEIRQRKLVQWGFAYLGAAWLIVQVLNAADSEYDLSSFFVRGVHILLVVGFIAALVLAWYHGERGAQKVSGIELAILSVLLFIAGVGVMLIGGNREATEPEALVVGMDSVAVVANVVDPTTVAVLPFETPGGEDYFADGLTVELNATLSRIPGLRLSGTTSSFVFKGSDARADSIGRALGVAHLVEGDVRTSGDRLRVNARLLDASTGIQEWAETYDRDMADVLAVQEEIARAIAFQLRAKVGTEALVGESSSDSEAYRSTLEGLSRIWAPDRSPETTKMLPRYFEAAIERDSTYAPAWAGLSVAHRILGDTGAGDWDTEWEKARTAAERALSLDPNQAMAHRILGHVAYSYDGDLRAAQSHFQRAVELNPTDGEAWARLGFARLFWGDRPGALQAADQAVEADPFNPWGLLWSGLVNLSAGEFERGLALQKEAYALLDNRHTAGWLAEALAVNGRAEEAVNLLRPWVERESWTTGHLFLAYAYAKAGDRENAEQQLAGSTREQFAARAAVEVAFGDEDAAFAALDQAVASSEPYLADAVVYPEYIPLHDDPRWAPLVARIRAGAGGSPTE